MKNIKSMDLNLLKALDALLDEHNVTRAAARLGLTQPALSGMLTRLRESFGDPLFARSRQGIVQRSGRWIWGCLSSRCSPKSTRCSSHLPSIRPPHN